MDKTKKWRKILAMMLTIVMMLQNAQSVMVFADVTNEQIEQRLAGGQTQTERKQKGANSAHEQNISFCRHYRYYTVKPPRAASVS